MKPIYFNLLKYVHSPFLGEEVNVAMLFYFPEQRRLEFCFPESLRRLRGLYRNLPERQLRVNLQCFGERIDRANKELQSELSPDEYAAFIKRELLNVDATVLRFSTVVKAIPHFKNAKAVVESYYELYFSDAQAGPLHERTKDEGFLLSQFRNSLKSQDPGAPQLLSKNITVQSPTTALNFDYGWKNGTLNLIKPISFDLKNESEIHKKALLYYGNFNLLAKTAKEHKYRFDILVGRPTNPKLNKEYNKAIGILQETSAPSRVVTEGEQLAEYSETAARYLREHSQPTNIGLFLPPSFN